MMDNELNLDDSVINLELDDGSQLICDIIAIFPAGDYEYIALLPQKETQDGEVLIYRFAEDEEGQPLLANIETDEEFELVEEAFDELQDELMYDELIAEGELDDIEFDEEESFEE